MTDDPDDRPPRVIARQGEYRYLLVLEPSLNTLSARGLVLDTRAGVVFGPLRAHSLLRAGYWDPYDPSPAEAADLLAQARSLPLQNRENPSRW